MLVASEARFAESAESTTSETRTKRQFDFCKHFCTKFRAWNESSHLFEKIIVRKVGIKIEEFQFLSMVGNGTKAKKQRAFSYVSISSRAEGRILIAFFYLLLDAGIINSSFFLASSVECE